MKKIKNDNKGFTLVELIVVLVILAILAAILVPALLGYIDEAKNKQLELHGKSVYTAAQAVASKMYAKNAVPKDETNKKMDGTQTDKAYFISETKKLSEISSFGTSAEARVDFGTTGTDKYKVVKISYTEDGTNWVNLDMSSGSSSWVAGTTATASEVTITP